jgi:ferredoxin
MISIDVSGREGNDRTILVAPGGSLMEALRNHGFDDLLATCGGCCSCATCHIYVESGPAGYDQVGSDDENDLLDSSTNRQSNSRLACQIQLVQSLERLSIKVAPED